MPSAAVSPQSWTHFSDVAFNFELDPPTPAKVREWVSELFQNQHISLAIALAEAGLALYPDSEDVLVIAALVSEVQQDWPRSRELLEHLIQVQNGNTPADVWYHLARVLRCQGQLERSRAVVLQALRKHPSSTDLQQLATELDEVFLKSVNSVPGT